MSASVTAPAASSTLLFPLPLSTMEREFLAASVSHAPMQFQVQCTLSAPVSRPEWIAATEAAVARHPLLAAVVCTVSFDAWEWRPFQCGSEQIEWRSAAEPAASITLDPCESPGWRMILQPEPEQRCVLFVVHHVCCDALGAMQFLCEVAERYLAISAQRAPNLPQLSAERLIARGSFGLSRWGWMLRTVQDGLGLLGLFEYVCHRPRSFAVPVDITAEPVRDAEHPQFTLSAEDTRKLRECARIQGVTLNDMLVTALFQSLQDQLAGAAEHIRIAIPMNLRGSADRATPAANLVSLTFLDRRPERFSTSQSLLRSVNRELWLCKLWNAGLTFVRIVGWRQWLCRVLRRPPSGFPATAILSNLGEVTASESVASLLSEMSFAPPFSADAPLAIGVVTWNQRMTIAFNCDRTRIGASDAGRLLRNFEQRLRDWTFIAAHRS